MGKKAKAHRAKVQKRNRTLSQERYTMQNSLTKMMKEIKNMVLVLLTEKVVSPKLLELFSIRSLII
jgi:hypothetical protein